MKRFVVNCKSYLALMLVFVLMFCGLMGCSQGGEPTNGDQDANGDRNGQIISLNWGTGSLGSSAQLLVSAICDVNNRIEESLKLSCMTTAGGVANPRLLRDKEIDICHTTNAHEAFHAIYPYEGEEPVELYGLFTLYMNLHTFVVLEDSSIQTFEDLAGKTIQVGPPGSGAESCALLLLDKYGLLEGPDKVKTINLSYGEGNDALIGGDADAIVTFMSAGVASPTLAQLITSKDIRFLQIDEAKLTEILIDNPGFSSYSLSAGAFEGLKEDLSGLANVSAQYTDSRISEDIAYTITKNVYDNLEDLAKYHDLAKYFDVETAVYGIPKDISIHPGAVKYYKEVGAWDTFAEQGWVEGTL